MPYITNAERFGLQRGLEQGLERGLLEGRQQGEANLIIRLLKRRISSVPSDLESQIRKLSVEQLEDLGEALLDFSSEQDLIGWLAGRS